MEQCKITVNKNNGSISLKGLKNKKQFKQDDAVVIMLKSEYDNLINSINEFNDNQDLHNSHVNPADVQADLYVNLHNDSNNRDVNESYDDLIEKNKQLENELYHTKRLNESLEEHNDTLIKENSGLKVNESEMMQIHNKNAVLNDKLNYVSSELDYHKILNRALMNRKLWSRIINNVPDVEREIHK